MPEKNISYDSLKDVPASAWKKLSQKKIYFGHQSVGFNIIDGMKDIMKEHPEIKLNIVETTDESDFKAVIFVCPNITIRLHNYKMTLFRYKIRRS